MSSVTELWLYWNVDELCRWASVCTAILCHICDQSHWEILYLSLTHQLQISSTLAKQHPIPYTGLRQNVFVWKDSRTYKRVVRIGQRNPVYYISFTQIHQLLTLCHTWFIIPSLPPFLSPFFPPSFPPYLPAFFPPSISIDRSIFFLNYLEVANIMTNYCGYLPEQGHSLT